MSPPKSKKAAASKLAQYRRQEGEEGEEDGGAEREVGERGMKDTDRLLEAITQCRTSLTALIEEVKTDISLIRQDFQKLRERVTDANSHKHC